MMGTVFFLTFTMESTMDSYDWSVDRVAYRGNGHVSRCDAVSFIVAGSRDGAHEGWDNEAFEINGEWVFRFPKRADGELPLKRELTLLPRLSTVLPVPVPVYQWIGQPGPSFPYYSRAIPS